MPGHMRVKAKPKKVERSARPSRVAAIAMAVVAVAAVGIFAVARQPSPTSSSATLKAVAPTMPAAKSATTPSPAKAPAGAKQEKAAKGSPVDRARATPAAFTAPAAASSTEGTVSVTGCLERSDRVFRLTDTQGTSAPTARSWKSGFLKKRSANLTVVSAANSVQLSNYAGQRVKLVGTLSDRELRARSAVTISRSCS
jgi:hypothetical protein